MSFIPKSAGLDDIPHIGDGAVGLFKTHPRSGLVYGTKLNIRQGKIQSVGYSNGFNDPRYVDITHDGGLAVIHRELSKGFCLEVKDWTAYEAWLNDSDD